MNRKEKITSAVNSKTGIGLELGPLSSPVVLKSESKVFYVDHMSTSDLKTKYKDEPVVLDDIVNVDYVVGKKSLKTSVGGKKFDYVIASHVIEHIPDVIRWLKDINSVLKPGGVLSLVIPDKRYTFDITRRTTDVSDVIGAYIEERKRVDSSTMFDYLKEYRKNIYAYEVNEKIYEDFINKPRRYNPEEVWELTRKNAKGIGYVDSHCSVFTPYSFFEIIKYLIEYDLFDFEVVDFIDTAPSELEFYVSLRKCKPNTSKLKKRSSVPTLKAPLTEKQLQYQISELVEKLKLLNDKNLSLENEINEYVNSKSWKITKPLRDLVKAIKRSGS